MNHFLKKASILLFAGLFVSSVFAADPIHNPIPDNQVKLWCAGQVNANCMAVVGMHNAHYCDHRHTDTPYCVQHHKVWCAAHLGSPECS